MRLSEERYQEVMVTKESHKAAEDATTLKIERPPRAPGFYPPGATEPDINELLHAEPLAVRIDSEQVRELSASEGAQIAENVYGVSVLPDAWEGCVAPGLAESGQLRNVERHTDALGRLIIAALSFSETSPRELFGIAVRGAGWSAAEADEFLDRDPGPENLAAMKIDALRLSR